MKRACALLLTFILVSCVFSACAFQDVIENFTEKEEEETGDEGEPQPVDVTAKDKYAIVTQKDGDPYGQMIVRAFQSVCTNAEKECVVRSPEHGLASEQIDIVKELIDMEVSAIAISPIDPESIQSTLKKAIKAGINVCSYDTPATPESRQLHVSGSKNENITAALMDAILDLTDGEGEWAIMASYTSSYNQTQWIDAMKEMAKDDEKYQTLKYKQTAYCEDDYRKAYDQTVSILSMSPDVEVIIALSTTAMKGAAQAVIDKDSDVFVTGIGLPTEMQKYLGSDNACPYLFMWSPTVLGKVTASVTIGLGTGKITGEAEEQFRIGDEEVFQITEADDGGTEVIVDYPRHYDSGNIADLADDN